MFPPPRRRESRHPDCRLDGRLRRAGIALGLPAALVLPFNPAHPHGPIAPPLPSLSVEGIPVRPLRRPYWDMPLATAPVRRRAQAPTARRPRHGGTPPTTLARGGVSGCGGELPTFTLQSGGALGEADAGLDATPTFADLDGDGDPDAFVGSESGFVLVYENTGTATSPIYRGRFTDIFVLDGVIVPYHSAPAFADLDGDGDFDVFVGERGGAVVYFENRGTATAPTFARDDAANPLAGVDVGSYAKPTFADIDGDGDLDAFVGTKGGKVQYFENTGTAVDPTFARDDVGNPFAAEEFEGFAAPALADLDGDGDLDALIGHCCGGGADLVYLENTGTAAAATFVRDDAANPFADEIDSPAPAFADLDSDGDLDVVVGEFFGRVFTYVNDCPGVTPTLTRLEPANPLAGADVGSEAAPAVADLDGDGDLDALVGTNEGTVVFYANRGTAVAPDLVRDDAGNPLDGEDVGSFAVPAVADLDGDGDLDAFVGTNAGTVLYFENRGTAIAPDLVRDDAGNPFAGEDVGFYAAPAFADLDGDGDLDAFVGNTGDAVVYYENRGTAVAPDLIRDDAGNPLANQSAGFDAKPAFADLDGDGNLDAFVGERGGTVVYLANIGTATAPDLVRDGGANPLAGADVGEFAAPTFADFDGDGDLDALVGAADGTVAYFENAAVPVPVALASFTARLDGDTAALAWTTAQERDNAGFDVLHLAPGAVEAAGAADPAGAFAAIGFVAGAGDSDAARDYAFRTGALAPGAHAFRLRQVDRDGASELSEIVVVTVEGDGATPALALYPNPAADVVSVRHGGALAGAAATEVAVTVTDAAGRVVLEARAEATAAGGEVRLDVSVLPEGVYGVRVEGGGAAASARLVKE